MQDLIIEDLKNKIYTIRNKQVILDSDLANLYRVETKVLNQAVNRNINRFPLRFRFQLTKEEFNDLRSQNVTSSWGGTRKLPIAFTEPGVSMLAGILKSTIAIKVSINIIDTFVAMRNFISNNAQIFSRLESIERKQINFEEKTNVNFNKVFDALENHEPKQGIFFDGQIFDAHKFVSDLINSAKNEVILIDNYIDNNTLLLFSTLKGVKVIIYTNKITDKLRLGLKKFNEQYFEIKINKFAKSHDRFLIIDREVYHFGASLKDLGKKWFAFSKFDIGSLDLLQKL
ncbi:MAG: ORF6N domain-containing protein [Nanoarchaeota archaeon]|nr:ORF6N domain-containing protein [Nanoarchaeota archaeon]